MSEIDDFLYSPIGSNSRLITASFLERLPIYVHFTDSPDFQLSHFPITGISPGIHYAIAGSIFDKDKIKKIITTMVLDCLLCTPPKPPWAHLAIPSVDHDMDWNLCVDIQHLGMNSIIVFNGEVVPISQRFITYDHKIDRIIDCKRINSKLLDLIL
jgi:hypothetical protein